MQFWLEFAVLVILLAVAVPFLGAYMAKLFSEESRIGMRKEMTASQYALSAISLTFFGILILFLVQLMQGFLPFNPQNFPHVPPLIALHTAVSFATNTNLQAYAGERSLSYGTQMLGITTQHFLSAAIGWASLMALIRGLYRHNFETLGNFWDDVEKITLYLFLPLSIVFGLFLVSQGVIQSISAYVPFTTLEGKSDFLPLGPVASQEAIKLLGSNGGGFFSVNSCHPFENPTPLSNFFETFFIMLIPAATIYAYGVLIKDKRHSLLLLGVVSSLFLAGMVLSFYGTYSVENARHLPVPIVEGIETRLGTNNSLLFTSAITATSNGATNAMISSLSPLSGCVALFQIIVGEVIFGGVGVGMDTIILFVLLTVFLSGLMVGRTPEYLGKKIEIRDVQWIIFALLIPSALILLGTATALLYKPALEPILNKGPHGFFEILYVFASAALNNGSALNGLKIDTPFYTLALSFVMLIGRFAIIVPSLFLAGNLVQKKAIPPSIGIAPVNTLLFAIILVFVIIIIGALTFCPALFLGPLVEHFSCLTGRVF